MYTDLHVHVGTWFNKYYYPIDIGRDLLNRNSIDLIGVSSTTACVIPYNIESLCQEVEGLMNRFPGRIFHWLWLHPDHIPSSFTVWPNIPIHGIKVHPYLHDWHSDPSSLIRVFSLAQNENVPVLLHTGGRDESNAGRFINILKKFATVEVVLAHARPIEEAIEVAYACPNAWFDTAFVSAESLETAKKAGILDRFVFGSDYPIDGPEQGRNYTDITSCIDVSDMKTVQTTTRRFLLGHFYRDLVDELERICLRIWNSGENWYKLRGVDRSLLTDESFGLSDLKEQSDEAVTECLKTRFAIRYQSAANEQIRILTATDYVAKWGGIRCNSNRTIASYVRERPEIMITRGIKGVASWSKILTLEDPLKYAAYDSRVALALNQAIDNSCNYDWRFPLIPSRSVKRAPRINKLKSRFKGRFISGNIFYTRYLNLIGEVAHRTGTSLQRVEMALFMYGGTFR